MSAESKRAGHLRNAHEVAEHTYFPDDAKQAIECCDGVYVEIQNLNKLHGVGGWRDKPHDVFSPRYAMSGFPESVSSIMESIKGLLKDDRMAAQFQVDQEGVAWFYVVRPFPAIVECDCPCHEPGSSVMHFAACCQGSCSKCHKGFHSGRRDHQEICTGGDAWEACH